MNHILKVITDHPEAFDLEFDGNTSEDELLQIIYSVKKLGTSVQQNSMAMTKLYFGWTVLVKLGLRARAVPMGAQLLQTFNWSNHYLYAADICNYLMKHYFMFDNGIEAEKYEDMFKEYKNIYFLEAEMETLYCKIIYKNDHGLEINKAAVDRDLKELESRLQFYSSKYHFYFYQCKCILSEGAEYEQWCLKALAYFKNLYFKHELYYNAFIKKLYTYYLDIEDYNKVRNEIPNYICEAVEGSKSWFRLKYILIMALLNTESIIEADEEIDLCMELKGYSTLSKAHQEEWEYLAATIKNKIGHKTGVNKKNG